MQPEDSPHSGAQGPQEEPMVEDLDIIYSLSFQKSTLTNGRH